MSPHGGGQKGTKRKRGKTGEEDEDTEDWTRQRKDNHKEVERRRRGNINEGINELARIVPNGSGEKAKVSIYTISCPCFSLVPPVPFPVSHIPIYTCTTSLFSFAARPPI